MNVVGIIAEYNPFHQGHAYQIKKLKEICHADYVVIAMSGNFVQRGAPALMDKYSRTEMAISLGADLVLELPALFATASAESFAFGGVSLLNSAGIVTHLGFGAESGNLPLLTELAALLLKQPAAYRKSLDSALKKGRSFPAARQEALLTCGLDIHVSEHEISELLASPNNILALEYLKALAASSSRILPVPILRKGRGYHDTVIEDHFCSASAIRAFLQKNSANRSSWPETLSEKAMPKAAYQIICEYPHPFLFEEDFSMLLHYKLLTEDKSRLAGYGASSPFLAGRLLNERDSFCGWNAFCQHMKTKNITYTRLSRLFLHMLLNITKEDYRTFPRPSYLRVLGFASSAAPLLAALKKNSQLPVITRLSYAPRLLSSQAQKLLSVDLRASDLYALGLTSKGDATLKNDYRRQILRL